METFKIRGKNLREEAKQIVLEYMKEAKECQKNSNGIKLAQLFRNCGFDWGEYENATSSNQQYWCVALVRELEKNGKIERLDNKQWRLC